MAPDLGQECGLRRPPKLHLKAMQTGNDACATTTADALELPCVLFAISPSILKRHQPSAQLPVKLPLIEQKVQFDTCIHEGETYSSVEYDRGMYLRRPTPAELLQIRAELYHMFGHSQYLAGKVPGERKQMEEWHIFGMFIGIVLLLVFQGHIESLLW